MATIAMSAPPVSIASPRPMWHWARAWVLMIPFVFFAVHGNLPFESSGHPDTSSPLNGSSLAPLASMDRSLGVVGYVIIPGVTYAVVLYLILSIAGPVISRAMQMKVLTFLALFTICSALW